MENNLCSSVAICVDAYHLLEKASVNATLLTWARGRDDLVESA